jgi:hypothetical protein
MLRVSCFRNGTVKKVRQMGIAGYCGLIEKRFDGEVDGSAVSEGVCGFEQLLDCGLADGVVSMTHIEACFGKAGDDIASAWSDLQAAHGGY